ncbi:TauD/TfdA family dioxygenase [Aliamphritea ceti]|uniref:TauD/TfdA family dioxygenase n=1 Tax=Aliamphritea ceti TaxID=1524258 RepID=UPI0021C34B50|nr:TauD/TfdA family dioxygenase [Aliamphritea ceti]
MLGAIAAHLGNIFGYREQNGFVIHDIFPLQTQEFSNTGSSSRRSLAFHSDGASHPVITPDFLLLYCIRPDKQVCNHIIELPQLLASLPDTVIHMLKQPCFRHLVDEELRVVDKDNFIMQPVICEEQGRLIIKYDYDLTFGTDIHSCQALEILNQHIADHTTKLDNHANTLLVINNKTCLHGRSAFIPRYDGSDRWIQSAFVSRCNIRNGAVIHTQ